MTTVTGFPELAERMLGLSLGPAEAHGVLCGLLCDPSEQAEEVWLEAVLDNSEVPDGGLRAALHGVAERTREQLEGAGLALEPLLPSEDRPLRERAEAVYDWSRGFLYGLGLARVDFDALSPEAREGCDDLLAVTHLDLDDLEPSEENEAALMEVTELIRVAAMIVHTDCAARRP